MCALQCVLGSEDIGLMQSHSSSGAALVSYQLLNTMKHDDGKIKQIAASVSQLEKHVSHKGKKGKGKADPEWGQDEHDLASGLKTTIDSMLDFLTNVKNTAQAEWNAELASFHACETSKNGSMTGIVATKNQRVGTLRTLHKACRKSEWSSEDYQRKRDQVTGDAPLHQVPQVDDDLCTRTTWVKTDAEDYIDLRPDGQAAPSCASDQQSFENEYCMYYFLRQYTCETYLECVIGLDMEGKKLLFQDQEVDIKALWRLLKQLDCRIDRLLTAFREGADGNQTYNTSLFDPNDTCANEVYDTDNLTLTLDIPDRVTCAATSLTRPSTTNTSACTAWRTQEYNHWDMAAYGSTTEHGDNYVRPTGCSVTCDEDVHTTTTTPPPTLAPTASPTAAPTVEVNSGTCTVRLRMDNYIAGVWVDGVNQQLHGRDVNQNEDIIFPCDSQTVFTFGMWDYEQGCHTGGFMSITSSSTNANSDWNLVTPSSFKVYPTTCDDCMTVSGGQRNFQRLNGPAGWQDPSYVMGSDWHTPSNSHSCAGRNTAAGRNCVCDPASKFWLFRWSPSDGV